MNALSLILGLVFAPFTAIGSFFAIRPQEEIVVLYWGKFHTVLDRPGLHWMNFWGRTLIRVSRRQQTIEVPKNTVADGNGNPIIVSGIVTFAYSDARKVALEVEEAHEFVRTQAMAVLKQVASKYPYESRDGHNLKSEAQKVGVELVDTLQARVAPAGAKVIRFELSDLAYAPEIAPAMLIRQQASALVDARKIVVEGAVEIVREAIEMLESKGLALDGGVRQQLVSNLLTVICGESKVQPTVAVGAQEPAPDLTPVLTRLAERMEKMTGHNGQG